MFTGSIRDDPYWISWKKNSELIELSSINKVSRIILVYYCKCCNVIGYSTRYLFIIR